MKKIIHLALILTILLCCVHKQEKVDKIIEDGVEVILNHIEPYMVKDEPTQLVLEEELKIDFESREFTEFGLKEPDYVDSDSEGNIYVVDRARKADHFVMKFNKEGKFIKDICRKGQGPGEVQSIYFIYINQKDELILADGGNRKILILDKEGTLLDEKKYLWQWFNAIVLPNGNYLAIFRKIEEETRSISLTLFNSDFQVLKELDFFKLPYLTANGKNPYTIFTFYWRVKNGKIYIGNEQRGYEIWIFDFSGNLLKKIKKEYEAVKYPDEYRKQTEEIAKNNPDVGPWDYCPPFNSFFIDDDNRLFVMTYKQDENKEEYIHDIFNETGIFIGRKSIGLTYAVTRSLLPRRAVIKNDRYYRLRYKYSGYVELIVYKTVWRD